MSRNINAVCGSCPYFNSNRAVWTDEEIAAFLAIPNVLSPALSSEERALVEKALETPYAEGECRITQVGFWKDTNEDNWCGEHPDILDMEVIE